MCSRGSRCRSRPIVLALVLLVLGLGAPVEALAQGKPRVLVTTDINIGKGDPDDRQSMGHILMYADELDIRGLMADRFDAEGVEATLAAIAAYEQDYRDPSTRYREMGYPEPARLRSLVPRDPGAARSLLLREARLASPEDPLYVLVWGTMVTLRGALFQDPSIVPNLRVISIGTNIRTPRENTTCDQLNWNGPGRPEIFADTRFNDLWWVEIDWTYPAMWEEPDTQERRAARQMLDRVKEHGALGYHIWEVVQPVGWARYFRAGDTPSVLYLLDPGNPRDDPTHGSWAGLYERPFPDTRPNYYTDTAGGHEWDFANLCNSWQNAQVVFRARKQALTAQRPQFYSAWLEKLGRLYPRAP